jgi:hypothetical protein
MLVSIMGALIAARGGVLAAAWYARWIGGLDRARLRVRLVRLGRVLTLAWLVVSTWALTVLLATAAHLVSSYVPDDAAAMAWLRSNAEPGALLVNDTFADAGIWAPYTGGTPVLITRTGTGGADAAARELIVANISRLDQVPAAAAAACALNVRYAYYGAKQTAWQARKFPPRAAMQTSPALEEVFRSGDASLFRVRAAC